MYRRQSMERMVNCGHKGDERKNSSDSQQTKVVNVTKELYYLNTFNDFNETNDIDIIIVNKTALDKLRFS